MVSEWGVSPGVSTAGAECWVEEVEIVSPPLSLRDKKALWMVGLPLSMC